jgi:hypothetical protein
VPLNEDIPHNENERKIKLLKYYQWTPFILLFQALFFYLPRMIWRSLNDKSGLNMQSIVEAVYNFNADASKYTDRQKLLNYIANSFDHYVKSIKTASAANGDTRKSLGNLNASNGAQSGTLHKRRGADRNPTENEPATNRGVSSDESDLSASDYEDDSDLSTVKGGKPKSKLERFKRLYKIFCITKGKRYGNYLLALFVFVRFLYTINSIAQLFMLNHLLGNDFILLGVEVISKIWSGEDWTQLKRFPRVTMCDFRIREVGIVHRYTV